MIYAVKTLTIDKSVSLSRQEFYLTKEYLYKVAEITEETFNKISDFFEGCYDVKFEFEDYVYLKLSELKKSLGSQIKELIAEDKRLKYKDKSTKEFLDELRGWREIVSYYTKLNYEYLTNGEE